MAARHPYRRGDVVLVSFPFSAPAGQKDRPAVVLSADAYHDDWDELLLVAITSRAPKTVRSTDCALNDWKKAGLQYPSWVRSHLATVDRRLITKKLGSLVPADLSAVEQCLRLATLLAYRESAMNPRRFYLRPAWRRGIVAGFIGLSLAALALGVRWDAHVLNDRLWDVKHYHQIAIAMHAYHDVVGHFPSAAICSRDGKPLLSWRVAILPYLEEAKLYKQFKLDEPWDGEHNKKLLSPMPVLYTQPGVTPAGSTDTHYRVFVGPEAPFTGARENASPKSRTERPIP